MYGEVPASNVIPPVVAAGTVAVLPTTGANLLVSLAGALGAGLITWGVVYLYMTKIKAQRS